MEARPFERVPVARFRGPVPSLVALLLAACSTGSGSVPVMGHSGQDGGKDRQDVGSQGDAGSQDQDSGGSLASESDASASSGASTGDRLALCDSEREDQVRAVFCGDAPPKLQSLQDLQDALSLRVDQDATGDFVTPGDSVAVLGHSTALSGHGVSPINPRLIVMTPTLVMTYQRGVQQVEFAASDYQTGSFNFYLLRFEQTCNQRPKGCLPGDLYTLRVERDWVSWRLEDDEQLKNTPQDCRQCHQRARERPVLLMRELNSPWTHFFQPVFEDSANQARAPGVQGDDLLRDYVAAKGDEPYGGFRLSTLTPIAPFLLESLVGADQPLLFDAPGIESERWPWHEEAGYLNDPQPSPTWEEAYAAFKRGEQLALPYLKTRPVDPERQATASEAYARFRAGEIDSDELPDLADIFPQDPLERARIGLQTEPGADAVEILIQACGSCHNDVLDQSLSRARFNINLWSLDPSELALAVERIQLTPDEYGVMPPPEARQLDTEGRQRLLAYLKQDPLADEPDPRLVRAAELGMAGGGSNRTTTGVQDIPR